MNSTMTIATATQILAEQISALQGIVASTHRTVALAAKTEDRNELAVVIREQQALTYKAAAIMKRMDIALDEMGTWMRETARVAVASDAMDKLITRFLDNRDRIWQLQYKLFIDKRSILWGIGNQLVELSLGELAEKNILFLLRELQEKTNVLQDSVRNINSYVIMALKLIREQE